MKPPVALVIDDSPDMRLIMSSLCRQVGLEVVAVRDGETALATAAAAPPDIVCLDLMLPTLSGLEVCERLKSQPATSGVPVLVASARNYPQDRAEAYAVGADAYVTKPIDPERFTSEVRSLLWKRRLAPGA